MKKDVENAFLRMLINFMISTVLTGVITNYPIYPLRDHIVACIVCGVIYIFIFLALWLLERSFIKKEIKVKRRKYNDIEKNLKYTKRIYKSVVTSIHNNKSNSNIVRNMNVYNNVIINRSNIASPLYLLFQRKNSYALLLPIKKGMLVFAGSSISDLTLNNKTSFRRGGRSDRTRRHVHQKLLELKKQGTIKGRIFVKPYLFNAITPTLNFISQTPAARQSSNLEIVSSSTSPNINNVTKRLKSNLNKYNN